MLEPRTRTAKPRRRAFTGNLSLTASLHGTEGAWIASGQDPHELVVEVVRALADVRRDPIRVHLPAPLDVLLETLIEVLLAAAVVHRGLVVQLDLADDQAREALGVVVGVPRL